MQSIFRSEYYGHKMALKLNEGKWRDDRIDSNRLHEGRYTRWLTRRYNEDWHRF